MGQVRSSGISSSTSAAGTPVLSLPLPRLGAIGPAWGRGAWQRRSAGAQAPVRQQSRQAAAAGRAELL